MSLDYLKPIDYEVAAAGCAQLESTNCPQKRETISLMSLLSGELSIGQARLLPQSGPPSTSEQTGLHLGLGTSGFIFSCESARHIRSNLPTANPVLDEIA